MGFCSCQPLLLPPAPGQLTILQSDWSVQLTRLMFTAGSSCGLSSNVIWTELWGKKRALGQAPQKLLAPHQQLAQASGFYWVKGSL